MNNRKPYGWPFQALKGEIEISDMRAVSDRMRERCAEEDRRMYARLDRLSPFEALSEALNGLLVANGYFAYALRHRVGGTDAEKVANFSEKAVAEAMVAACAIIMELQK